VSGWTSGDTVSADHTATWLSDEACVAIAPAATYRRLLADDTPVTIWGVLRRPALVLLVMGVTVPIMTIQRVTVGLVATALASWSFVVAIQMMVGAAVIATAPARRVRMARSLDLWFATSLPYSLWLLTVSVWASTDRGGASTDQLIVSALAPAVWTAFLVSVFCRTVLGTTAFGSYWRAAVHQAAVWLIGLSLVAWSAGGWFQVVAAVVERANGVR
jgi:hypothetical protein